MSPIMADGATSSSPEPRPATPNAARQAHRPGSTASIAMPPAEIAQPATMTGRRPSVSAARPAGSSATPFIAAKMRNPMPVQTGDRCKTSRTNRGTMAPRTPSAAKPSARFAEAAAR
jgi:hypothetical protein